MTLEPAAKRERAARLATDYSAFQRERDGQDRTRGWQRRGPVSEGSERMSAGSLDRETERVDRPPLSETTEIETKLHSANESRENKKPTGVSSETVTNSREKKDSTKFAKDFASKYKK